MYILGNFSSWFGFAKRLLEAVFED